MNVCMSYVYKYTMRLEMSVPSGELRGSFSEKISKLNSPSQGQAQTLSHYRILAEVTQVTGPNHHGDDLPVLVEVYSLDEEGEKGPLFQTHHHSPL